MIQFLMLSGAKSGCAGRLTVGESGGAYGSSGGMTNTTFVWSGGDGSVSQLVSVPSFQDLRIELIQTGDQGVELITEVRIESGAGSLRVFDSGDASYTFIAGPNVARWDWGDGSNPVYQSGDEAEVHPYSIR